MFHGTKLTLKVRFVCATSGVHSEITVLSSYYSDRRGNDLRSIAKIWEVARATSAATSFFDDIVIGYERFLDGATGANNPIYQLWTEATDTFSEGPDWRLEDRLQCLVSVGTGKLELTAFNPSLLDIVGKWLVSIATNSERDAETFQKLHMKLFQERRAFRFNVGQGLEKIGLEEESKMAEIQAFTRRYIATEEVFTLMKVCVKNLRERECMLEFS